jgi:hypothetical protein
MVCIAEFYDTDTLSRIYPFCSWGCVVLLNITWKSDAQYIMQGNKECIFG